MRDKRDGQYIFLHINQIVKEFFYFRKYTRLNNEKKKINLSQRLILETIKKSVHCFKSEHEVFFVLNSVDNPDVLLSEVDTQILRPYILKSM